MAHIGRKLGGNMKPKDLIAAKNEGKKMLIIEGRKDALITLIASPYATSAEAGNYTLFNSIMFETKGQDGVIVISVSLSGKNYGYFLEVLHEDGEGSPRVNLNHTWFPAHVPAQIERPDFSVVIDGVRFSTEEDKQNKGGYRYVPDRALMAKFVYNQASAEEVKASASEYVEEISAREKLKEVVDACNTISKKLEKAEADAKYHEDNAQKTRHALDCASVLLGNNSKKIDELTEVLKDLKEFFMVVGGMLSAKGKIEGDDEKMLTDLYDEIASKHHEPLNILKP